MKEELKKVSLVYKSLKEMQIEVETIGHPIVKSCLESKEHYDKQGYSIKEYGLCKNLFIRDKKGKNFWLVIVDYLKEIDMSSLRTILGTSKLGPATNDNLADILAVESGSVSLFSVLNDKEMKVKVIIDNSLMTKKKLAFHPNYSGMTSFISKSDTIKFLEETKREYCLIDVPSKEYEYSKTKVLTSASCVNYY